MAEPGTIIGLGFEQVIKDAPVAIAVINASGRVIYSNAKARELTRRVGRDMPAGLDDSIDIFYPDGSRYERRDWPAARSLASGESVVGEEFFHELPLGGRLWSRCSSSPVRDENSEIVAAVLAMVEVTELKRQEERATHLAELLDHLQDAVLVTDGRFVLTAWNQGAVAMFGWTAEEAIGRVIWELVPQDSGERQADDYAELTRTGQWRGERVWRAKDGAPVVAEGLTAVIRGDGGDITGYIGIVRDVAERKRAEQATRESQRRIETILESVTDAFYALDRDWRLTYVNERALEFASQLAGRELTRDEMLGEILWTLYPGTVGTWLEDTYRRAMREQEPVAFEYQYPGSEPWMEVHVYPSEQGLSVYFQEITERKRVEEELRLRGEQQALLAELGRRALGSDDLQWVLDEAVGMLVRALGVELACVAELPAGRDEVILRAGAGWREGYIGRRFERGRESQVGYTLLRDEPVVAEDQANDPRFKRSALADNHGVVSALSVMIESPDQPFGVLEVLSTRRRSFSPSEVGFVQAVANVLASAVERSRAHERLLEVLEAERRRIARDLHDEALQTLTHALTLALVGRAPSAGGVDAPPDELPAVLRSVGEQLRAAIYDLRLRGEQRTPFPQLLEALVAVHRTIAVDLKIELDLRGGLPAGPLGATGTETLRIVGEALTNARRHARARCVRVSVWGSDGKLHAEVFDDGRGFEPARVGRRGIAGMHERAALLHGRLDIVGAPTTGTTVRLEVPIRLAHERATEQVRVLLVDDHATVREAIAGTLERESDLTVVGQAESLAQARGMLHGVDVAVLDLGLPDGDGLALIPELRQASPDVEVLVLSANLDRAQTARAIEAGAADALDKIAHLDQVVDAIRRLRVDQAVLGT